MPYSLYALNQKCAEAKLVTVGAGRRLGEAEAAGRRLVAAVVITPEQCWQACSANGYPSGSYFYVFQPGSGASDECYCCPTCTAIYAPGAKVYKMNEAAEQYKECGSGIGCGIEVTNPCPPVRRELRSILPNVKFNVDTPVLSPYPTDYQECIQGASPFAPSTSDHPTSDPNFTLSLPLTQHVKTRTPAMCMLLGLSPRGTFATAKRSQVAHTSSRIPR